MGVLLYTFVCAAIVLSAVNVLEMVLRLQVCRLQMEPFQQASFFEAVVVVTAPGLGLNLYDRGAPRMTCAYWSIVWGFFSNANSLVKLFCVPESAK